VVEVVVGFEGVEAGDDESGGGDDDGKGG